MKKLSAVLLIIGILLTSVLAVNSFAAETAADTPAGTVATPSDPAPEIPEKLLAPDWSDMIYETEEYSADYKMNLSGIEMKGDIHGKGSNIKVNLKIKSVSISILLFENRVYYYLAKLPFFYLSVPNSTDYLGCYSYPTFNLLEAYYDENGYQIEKYSYGSHLFNNYHIYTYCFDGNNLVSLSCELVSEGQHMEYTNFSYEVNDKDVALPRTAIFNLTWFLG